MNAIFEAALEVERVCRARGFGFGFIGGLAVQRWGQPRMTADVDLTLILLPLLELRDDTTTEPRLRRVLAGG